MEISKKHLINSILSRCLKVGLSLLVIEMIMRNNVLADAPSINIKHGPVYIIPEPLKIFYIVSDIINIVSVVAFIITGLNILITKIKSKKQHEPIKVKKCVKNVFIISIIVIILNIITSSIINSMNFGYYAKC